jgi:hypothetical protein
MASSSTTTMAAVHSSKISVDFYRTTRRQIPEDRALYGTIIRHQHYAYLLFLFQGKHQS